MCIGGPKLLRQGRAKAKPRPSQGRAKASSRPRQGATRKKRTTDAPKGSPHSSFWDYLTPILQLLALIFHKIFVNLSFFTRILRILLNWNSFWMNFNMV